MWLFQQPFKITVTAIQNHKILRIIWAKMFLKISLCLMVFIWVWKTVGLFKVCVKPFFGLQITKFRINVELKQDKVPTLYWLPKLRKTPYKARFIAN
jgi:hypothetical protein